MTFTFSSDLISDLHKDAYGFRPSADFMDWWNNQLTDKGRQVEWEYLCKKVEQDIEREKEEAQAAVDEFEKELAQIRKGNPRLTEAEALAYMTPIQFEDNPDLTIQDVEYWVWQRGILFTDRGRDIVKMAYAIHEVK